MICLWFNWLKIRPDNFEPSFFPARSLEIFLQSLVETTAQYTNERKAKTMTTSHLWVVYCLTRCKVDSPHKKGVKAAIYSAKFDRGFPICSLGVYYNSRWGQILPYTENHIYIIYAGNLNSEVLHPVSNEKLIVLIHFSSRKHCIESEGKFDFLKDLVANIADIANEEDEGESSDKPKKQWVQLLHASHRAIVC